MIRLLLIGASMGGPRAVAKLVTALPEDFPIAVAIALHMPLGYTKEYARRLDAESAVNVVEASEGLALEGGRVVLARAGAHLQIRQDDDRRLRCHLDARTLDKPHRPSVDVLLASAAETIGRHALGVVLTGMGDDGVAGARALKNVGARVLTESESSCLIYGMPRAVCEAGLSDGQASIDDMLALIQRNL